MTIEQLAFAILQAARSRAGDDGAPMIETAKIIIALLQAVQTQAQQEEPDAGEGWLKLIGNFIPKK